MTILDEQILNIADFVVGTSALGPGIRAGIWVQGCPFHCIGCIAPDWILPGGKKIPVKDLADQILMNELIQGITLSGGEPMLQASGLAALIQTIKDKKPEINVICFTGYRYQDLLKKDSRTGIPELLSNIDLLIDGPYIQARNDNIGLRGSSNQKFYFFTDRLKNANLELQPRKVEINIHDGNAFIVGVPPKEFSLAWDNVLHIIREEPLL